MRVSQIEYEKEGRGVFEGVRLIITFLSLKGSVVPAGERLDADQSASQRVDAVGISTAECFPVLFSERRKCIEAQCKNSIENR